MSQEGEPSLSGVTSTNDAELRHLRTQSKANAPFVLPKIDISTFTGRAEEMRQLEAQLLNTSAEKVCSIVGLSGSGGMGKSALAFHFATLYQERFPDGVIGLPVDGKATHEIAREFARRCGEEIDEEDDRSAATIMQEVFAHRRMLLIFDNADRADLKALRPGGQRCALIVTTRDRLLPNAFDIPDHGIVDLPPLPSEDARQLLRRILGPERVDAELGAADRIIEITDGLPLALQIIGATLRGRQRSLTSYAESLQQEQTRLQRLQIRGDQDLNVTASLNLSLDLLNDAEIDFFACLSVCAKDGFSLQTAIVAGGLADEWETQDLLDRLYQLSLLNEVSSDRYVFHALVRVYAAAQARERNLWATAAQRHAEYFIDLVQSNNVKSPEIAEQLAKNFNDVLQSAQWLRENATSEDRKEAAYQFALALRPFLLKNSYSKQAIELMAGFQEWAEYLEDWSASARFKIQHAKYLALEGRLSDAEAILRTAQDSIDWISDLVQQQENQAKQLNSLGGILQKQGKFDEAIATFERQIGITEALNDKASLAIVLNRLGRLLQQQGKFDEAIALFERRIGIAEALNDQISLGIGLNCLGGLLQQQGKLDEAIATFERQIGIAEVLNDQKQLAIGLNCLGRLLQQQGKFDEAIATLQRAIAVEEGLGDSRGLAMVLSNLSTVLRAQGDFQEAICVLERIANLEKKLGNFIGVAMTLRTLGNLQRQQGDLPRAITSFRKAVEIDTNLGNSTQQTKSLIILAETLHEYGCSVLQLPDFKAEAETALRESYQIYEQIGDQLQAAIAFHSLGRAFKEMDRIEEAEDVLQKSRNILTDLKDDKQLFKVLNTLGGVLERKPDWKAAESIFLEGYDLAGKEKDVLGQAIICNSLGQHYAKREGKDNISRPRMYFIKSIKLGKQVDNQVHLAKAHTAWGQALIKYEMLEDAVVELSLAFDIETHLGNTYGLKVVTPKLTYALVKLNKRQEALDYCDRAIAATNGNPQLIQLKNKLSN